MHYLSLTLLLFFSAVSLLAQDAAMPTPTPPSNEKAEESPSPSPTATPTPTPESSPAPDVSPMPSPSIAPGSSATSQDVIPLPPSGEGTTETSVSESEVPLPEQQTGEALPDNLFADPNAVIPEEGSLDIPPAPPSGPSAEELERQLKIRYKEVRTQVEKDPEVRSLLEKAQSAKTFEDERAAYREYYRLLFKKMKKVDKALTARCDALEKAYIARLAQTRIEPTIPLNPPPVPEPLSN